MIKHHVIYIPGLGKNYLGQKILIQRFRLYGIVPHFFAANWPSDEDYHAKITRLNNFIEKISAQNTAVSLIGVSAGASLALNSSQSHKTNKINKIILICGKINNPQTIHKKTYQNNIAFRDALAELQITLKKLVRKDLEKIMTMRPISDDVVAVTDQVIPGAHNYQLKSKGHAYSIFLSISRYIKIPAAFIKQADKH